MAMTLRRGLLFLVAGVLILGGCRMAAKQPKEPPIPQLSADALQANCFIRLYRPDGSYYLTQQRQEFDAATGIVKVAGIEPDGTYIWQLSPGRFDNIEGRTAGMKWLGPVLSPGDYCRLVLGCFQGSAMHPQTQAGEAVRVLGNWCYPVMSESGLTWYRSKDATSADLVAIQTGSGSQLVARGYEYRKVREGQAPVPFKIEIFKADTAAMTEQRLMTLDYGN
jgi:hypothetical protein